MRVLLSFCLLTTITAGLGAQVGDPSQPFCVLRDRPERRGGWVSPTYYRIRDSSGLVRAIVLPVRESIDLAPWRSDTARQLAHEYRTTTYKATVAGLVGAALISVPLYLSSREDLGKEPTFEEALPFVAAGITGFALSLFYDAAARHRLVQAIRAHNRACP
jgi:hypothetical protein